MQTELRKHDLPNIVPPLQETIVREKGPQLTEDIHHIYIQTSDTRSSVADAQPLILHYFLPLTIGCPDALDMLLDPLLLTLFPEPKLLISIRSPNRLSGI